MRLIKKTLKRAKIQQIWERDYLLVTWVVVAEYERSLFGIRWKETDTLPIRHLTKAGAKRAMKTLKQKYNLT